jgi:hypothetical protein
MQVGMNKIRALALALTGSTALAAALCACSPSAPAGTSTLIDETTGSLCVPNSLEGPIQYGMTTLNTAQLTGVTTVESVELIDAEGVAVADAWVLPLDVWEKDVVTGAEVEAGQFDDYPKISSDAPVSIEPNSVVGLVVALDVEDAGGSVDHIRVHHHSDGRSYLADGNNRITVAPVGENCLD